MFSNYLQIAVQILSRQRLYAIVNMIVRGREMSTVAGVLALAIALSTVSCQAIRTARANPVDALKYE